MIMRRGGGFSSFHPKWTVETKRIPKINVFLQVFEDTVLAPNTVGLIDGQLAAIMQRFELRRNTRAFWQPDFGFRRHADGRHRHRHRASVCGGRGLRWKRFAV
jgi:hypothetical protein